MKKSRIERNIIVLAIFIVLAVGISGIHVSKNLNQIVNSIHKKASTDYKLIVIRDISLDLLEIENSIQLYALTKKRSDLENYERVNNRLKESITILSAPVNEDGEAGCFADSILYLVETKLAIWKEIKQINTVKVDTEPQFNELYSMLEKKEIDTVKVEVVIEPPKKRGIFKKIFGKKDSVVTRVDTTYIEKTIENTAIKEEVEELQTGLKLQERRQNRRELRLIQKNIQVTEKLNNLIAQIEKAERDSLVQKNEEADELATIIYRRLSAFSIMAVILLFVVLVLFIRYLQKANKVQKALTAAKLETEKLAQAKEVFMANVSHEMRTPVNAIYGLTEQLLQEQTTKNVDEKLDILLSSSKHLKEVVNDTLDFSKIQANKLKFKAINFDPDIVIKEILTVLKPEASAKNIELVYRCNGMFPIALLGDPFRLKQILINTIGNAIKFTEKGSVTLIAESKEIGNKQQQIQFNVIDTGIGISKHNLKIIFEDFVQIETDYTRKFNGTGLGLSIVKKLVELQKGEILIKSELYKGTNVSFFVPYKLGDSKNFEEVGLQNLFIPEEIKKLNILGVDDDEYNRYLLKTIFNKWGINSYVDAKNGNEAVQLVRGNDFDFILMDIRMPGLNGIEASKLIMKEKPASKIIALATINSEAEMKLCTEAGMKQTLAKPFAEQELLNTILSLLEPDNSDSFEAIEFDLKELERLVGGDRAFMIEMIDIFIRSTQSGIENIREALVSENWQEISEAAHKMAAPCKHIQANYLYNNLKILEKCTGNLESLKQMPKLVLSIEKQLDKINATLLAFSNSQTDNA